MNKAAYLRGVVLIFMYYGYFQFCRKEFPADSLRETWEDESS